MVSAVSGQQNMMNRIPGRGFRPAAGKGDSIARRTGLEDSITINYRFLDSSRLRKFDSTLYDFTLRYPLAALSSIPWEDPDLIQVSMLSIIITSGWKTRGSIIQQGHIQK
jgi:hypothetical protein